MTDPNRQKQLATFQSIMNTGMGVAPKSNIPIELLEERFEYTPRDISAGENFFASLYNGSVVSFSKGVAQLVPILGQAVINPKEGTKLDDFFDTWLNTTNGLFEAAKAQTSVVPSFFEDPSAKAMAQGLGQGLGFMLTLAVGGGAVGTASKFWQYAVGTGIGTTYMMPQLRQEAIDAGIDKTDASRFAAAAAPILALSEYVGFRGLGKIIDAPAVNALRREAVSKATKQFVEEGANRKAFYSAAQTMQDVMITGLKDKAKVAGTKAAAGLLLEGSQEFAQSYIQEGIEQVYDSFFSKGVDAQFGANVLGKEQFKAALEEAMYGGIIGFGMSGGGSAIYSPHMKESMYGYVESANDKAKAVEKLKGDMEYLVKSNRMTPQEMEYGSKMLEDIVTFTEQDISPNIKNKVARFQAFQLADMRKELLAGVGSDKSLTPDYIPEQIAMVERAMKEIANTNKPLDMGMVEKLLNDIEQKYKNPPVEEAEVADEEGGDKADAEWEVGQTATEQAQTPKTDIDGLLEGEQPEVGQQKADIEKKLNIKLPAKNTSFPVSPKTWGDKKSLANQISSELKGVVERGVPMQEWLDKGYGRQLATWTDETIVEFLEVVDAELKALQQQKTTTNEQDTSNQEESAELRTEEATQKEVEAQKADIERRRQEELKGAKIQIPRYFTFNELGGGRGESGNVLSSVESDRNRKIQEDFESKLEEGDKLIEPNGNVYYFKNGKVVKPNGKPRGMSDIGSFLNGVTIDRTEKINAKYDAELKALEQPSTTDTKADVESKIKIEPIHQEILNLLPDYSNVKISLENDRGGLGYVGDFKQREEDNSKNTRVSTTIKYSGIPSSEIYTHELLHYFTIPALILYQQGNRSENIKRYVEALDKLYTKAKSKGYTSINGVSVHDNLNEFAVNITNEKSIEQLKKLGIYDDLINLTKNYLNSLQPSTNGETNVIGYINSKLKEINAKYDAELKAQLKTTTNEQDTQTQAKQAEEELLVSLIDEIDMEVANLSKKRGEKAKKELQKQLDRKERAQKDLEDVRTELARLRGEPTDGVETGVGEEVGTGEKGVTQEELETEATPTEQVEELGQEVESIAKKVSIGLTPYASDRIPKYKYLNDILNSPNTTKQEKRRIIKEIEKDLRLRVAKILPKGTYQIKPFYGVWGETEISFELVLDLPLEDALFVGAKLGQEFDQDAVHVRQFDVPVSDNTVIGVRNDDGSATVPYATIKFNRSLTNSEFYNILKEVGLFGGTLSENGKFALIYNGQIFEKNQSKEASESNKSFNESVEKLKNYDSKGIQGTIGKQGYTLLHEQRRSDGEYGGRGTRSVQGTYGWYTSKFYNKLSQKVKRQLESEKDKTKWARESLKKPIAKALESITRLTPKIKNENARDYKRLENIGKIFDKMGLTDMSPEVVKAYSKLAKALLLQYKDLPIKVYPFGKAVAKTDKNGRILRNPDGSVQVEFIPETTDTAYDGSGDMINDVDENNQMVFYTTGIDTFGEKGVDYTGHPLLEQTGINTTRIPVVDKNGNVVKNSKGETEYYSMPMVYNDLLRIVHDYIAHAASGATFGARGEERAWAAHVSSIINDQRINEADKLDIIRALTIETRGQNTWVNFVSEKNKKVNDLLDQRRALIKEGKPVDEINKKIEELDGIEFSDQKVGLLPTETIIGGYPETKQNDDWVKRNLTGNEYVSPTKDGGTFEEVKIEPDKADVGDTEEQTAEQAPQFAAEGDRYFEYVPIEEVEPYKEFDRETQVKFNKSELDDLTDDIRKNGIKNPITIEVYNGYGLITEGNHRLAAAKRLGIKNIPLRVIRRNKDFGSINKEKAVKMPRKKGMDELKVFYPEIKLINQDNSPAAYGFTKAYPQEVSNSKSAEQAPQVRPQRQVKANQKIATQEVAEARGEDVKDMEVLYSNQFRNLPVIDDTDTDAMLTYEAEGMPTGLEEENIPPQIREVANGLVDKGYLYYNNGMFYLTAKGAEIINTIESSRATDVKSVLVSSLSTDEARFQNREGLDQQKVDSIAKNWNDAKQDPIHTWKDPKDGKVYVLSGHHRLAAAKKAGRANVKTVDMSYMSEAEAIQFATVEANANRTLEKPSERAKVYRKMINDGKTKKEVKNLAEELEGKNAPYVLRLAALNPNGRVMELVRQSEASGDKATQKEAELIADWIGDARSKYDLTNQHETEMFEALLDKGFRQRVTKKTDFLQKVYSVAGAMDYDKGKPLNIRRFKNETEGERAYDEIRSQIVAKISELQDKISNIKLRFSDTTRGDYISTNQADYAQAKAQADTRISELNLELKAEQKRLEEHQRNKGAFTRSQSTGSLFDFGEARIGENTLGSAIAGANMLDQAFKAGVDLSQSVEDNIQEMEDKGIIKKDCK